MKQNGSKHFASRPPPLHPPPKGLQIKIQLFPEYGHVAYQINGNHEMQQHGSKCFACRSPLIPHHPRGWGQKVKIQLFQNMVMLHITFIGITKCSKMVSDILPADPPPTNPRGQKVKNNLFQNNFMLHIKFKGIMNAATW